MSGATVDHDPAGAGQGTVVRHNQIALEGMGPVARQSQLGGQRAIAHDKICSITVGGAGGGQGSAIELDRVPSAVCGQRAGPQLAPIHNQRITPSAAGADGQTQVGHHAAGADLHQVAVGREGTNRKRSAAQVPSPANNLGLLVGSSGPDGAALTDQQPAIGDNQEVGQRAIPTDDHTAVDVHTAAVGNRQGITECEPGADRQPGPVIPVSATADHSDVIVGPARSDCARTSGNQDTTIRHDNAVAAAARDPDPQITVHEKAAAIGDRQIVADRQAGADGEVSGVGPERAAADHREAIVGGAHPDRGGPGVDHAATVGDHQGVAHGAIGTDHHRAGKKLGAVINGRQVASGRAATDDEGSTVGPGGAVASDQHRLIIPTVTDDVGGTRERSRDGAIAECERVGPERSQIRQVERTAVDQNQATEIVRAGQNEGEAGAEFGELAIAGDVAGQGYSSEPRATDNNVGRQPDCVAHDEPAATELIDTGVAACKRQRRPGQSVGARRSAVEDQLIVSIGPSRAAVGQIVVGRIRGTANRTVELQYHRRTAIGWRQVRAGIRPSANLTPCGADSIGPDIAGSEGDRRIGQEEIRAGHDHAKGTPQWIQEQVGVHRKPGGIKVSHPEVKPGDGQRVIESGIKVGGQPAATIQADNHLIGGGIGEGERSGKIEVVPANTWRERKIADAIAKAGAAIPEQVRRGQGTDAIAGGERRAIGQRQQPLNCPIAGQDGVAGDQQAARKIINAAGAHIIGRVVGAIPHREHEVVTDERAGTAQGAAVEDDAVAGVRRPEGAGPDCTTADHQLVAQGGRASAHVDVQIGHHPARVDHQRVAASRAGADGQQPIVPIPDRGRQESQRVV